MGTATDNEVIVCPQCGNEEDGFFCRQCGALLRGEDNIFCPRCHQIVPPGEFCNQCGQSLGGIALRLQQLALAGDEFWVTADTATAPPPPPEPSITWEPDESVQLSQAELPDWLREIAPESAPPPDVEARIYPALQPIEEEQESKPNYLVILVLLMFILMLGVVALTVFLLIAGQ